MSDRWTRMSLGLTVVSLLVFAGCDAEWSDGLDFLNGEESSDRAKGDEGVDPDPVAERDDQKEKPSTEARETGTERGLDKPDASDLSWPAGDIPEALAYWEEMEVSGVEDYSIPTAVETVEYTADDPLPRAEDDSDTSDTEDRDRLPVDDPDDGQTQNEAVHIEVTDIRTDDELLGHSAPSGHQFVLVTSDWENVHPPQEVDADAAEGERDHTMGVGDFASGETSGDEGETVELDVTYRLPRIGDHLYVAFDGRAAAMHPVSAELPGGVDADEQFDIEEYGQVRQVKAAFVTPDDATDLALRLLDYEFGHVLAAVAGDAKTATEDARDSDRTPIETGEVGELKLLVDDVDTVDAYGDEEAPAGWQYAVVTMAGRSLSGDDIGDIVQIEPAEYTWVRSDGGHLFYATDATTTDDGFLRFTPEVFQRQQIAFMIPADIDPSALGVRVGNEVTELGIAEELPSLPEEPRQTHRDGDVMDVEIFDLHIDGDTVVVDLAVRELSESSGLEIQPRRQFFVASGGDSTELDEEKTADLPLGRADNFVVPAATAMRFEIAFQLDEKPDSIRIRGFESEEEIPL